MAMLLTVVMAWLLCGIAAYGLAKGWLRKRLGRRYSLRTKASSDRCRRIQELKEDEKRIRHFCCEWMVDSQKQDTLVKPYSYAIALGEQYEQSSAIDACVYTSADEAMCWIFFACGIVGLFNVIFVMWIPQFKNPDTDTVSGFCFCMPKEFCEK